jgi:TRAP-type transport system small permease protein
LIHRAYSATIWFFEQMLSIVIAFLAILVVSAVFFRYVLHNSLTWSDELAGFLLVWVTFMGSITALERGKHINFDSLVFAFPKKVSRVLWFIQELFLFGFCGVLFWFGWQMSSRLMNQTAVSMPIPTGIVYIIMPIAGFMMMVILIYRWIVPREFATGHEAELEEAREATK